MHKKIVLALIAQLFCFAGLFNLSPAVASTWQVVTEGSGLCGRSVNCFAVYKNTMAVGTENGVSIFDGNSCSWSTLVLPEEVASTTINDLAIDEFGHCWLATNRGLIAVQGSNTFIHDMSNNLPTVDVNRVQINGKQIFVGCFGGYIASAFIPQTGMTRFTPVNYTADSDSGGFKIRSVGISAMAMRATYQGWVGTLGNGLLEISGSNEFAVKNTGGLAETWVNDFYIFHEGKTREMRTLAVTPEYLCLIKNNQSLSEIRLPIADQWLNCVVTHREDPEYYDWVKLPRLAGDEELLNDFIKRRSLYVGTKSSGLWRFYKGVWQQFTTDNSILPSNCINRLYVYKKLLLVCTDAGLVMIHTGPDRHDEFQAAGVGTPYNKTFFPFKEAMIYFQVVKGSSYWVSHQFGLTRWKANESETSNKLPQTTEHIDLSTRMEPPAKPSGKDGTEDVDGTEYQVTLDLKAQEQQESELENYWEHYTNEPEFATASNAFPIPYQKISCIVIDRSTDYLWLIFENRLLARMRLVKRIEKVDGKKKIVARADWQMLDKYVPWTDGERLNVVWHSGGKIYIGTSQGFYILSNPESEDMKAAPFQWQHYGTFQGLSIAEVRGFAFWNSQQGNLLAIMHGQGLSTWDGKDFARIELGGNNTCIKGGADGNLWIGTTKGLNRLDSSGQMYFYDSNNAGFESNNITAIGILPSESNSLGIWVACDGYVKYTENGQGLDGSDKMPHLFTRPDGVKVAYDDYSISDIRFHSTSFHFYDGLTWEIWRIAGVRDILIDRNYIWTTSNIRVRRMRINHSDN